jgi:hypothetical protein
MQFHFWEDINRNQIFILDSHRPFICSVHGLSYSYVCLSWLCWAGLLLLGSSQLLQPREPQHLLVPTLAPVPSLAPVSQYLPLPTVAPLLQHLPVPTLAPILQHPPLPTLAPILQHPPLPTLAPVLQHLPLAALAAILLNYIIFTPNMELVVRLWNFDRKCYLYSIHHRTP